MEQFLRIFCCVTFISDYDDEEYIVHTQQTIQHNERQKLSLQNWNKKNEMKTI